MKQYKRIEKLDSSSVSSFIHQFVIAVMRIYQSTFNDASHSNNSQKRTDNGCAVQVPELIFDKKIGYKL